MMAKRSSILYHAFQAWEEFSVLLKLCGLNDCQPRSERIIKEAINVIVCDLAEQIHGAGVLDHASVHAL